MTDDGEVTALATYGTLSPGKVNHHVMAGMNGVWSVGRVRGALIEEGWGADHGCPGLRLSSDGDWVRVDIFISPDLPDHWTRLDAFEGSEYRRVNATATTEDGERGVWIYVLA